MTASHDLARATLDLAEAVISGAPPARLLRLAERAARMADAALDEEGFADHAAAMRCTRGDHAVALACPDGWGVPCSPPEER